MNRRANVVLGLMTVAMLAFVGISFLTKGQWVIGGVIVAFGAVRAGLLVRDLQK